MEIMRINIGTIGRRTHPEKVEEFEEQIDGECVRCETWVQGIEITICIFRYETGA